MSKYAQLDFRKNPEVASGKRSEARMAIIRMLMVAAIAGIVVAAVVAELRWPSEQRIELFNATYDHP